MARRAQHDLAQPDRLQLAREFAPLEFVRRPPPTIVAVYKELGLPTIVYGLLSAVGLITVLLIASGTDLLVGARGAIWWRWGYTDLAGSLSALSTLF